MRSARQDRRPGAAVASLITDCTAAHRTIPACRAKACSRGGQHPAAPAHPAAHTARGTLSQARPARAAALALSLAGLRPSPPPMMQMACSLMAPVKGTWMSSSGSSSSLCSVGSEASSRRSQGLNTCLAEPGTASFRHRTCGGAGR